MTDRIWLAGRIRRERERRKALDSEVRLLRSEVQRCERAMGLLARQLRDFQLGLKHKPKRTRGRQKQPSTQVIREIVYKVVAEGLEATDEQLRTLMTEGQRQRWARRRILPDRMRSKLVHQFAAKQYGITMADVRRYLREESDRLRQARSRTLNSI